MGRMIEEFIVFKKLYGKNMSHREIYDIYHPRVSVNLCKKTTVLWAKLSSYTTDKIKRRFNKSFRV